MGNCSCSQEEDPPVFGNCEKDMEVSTTKHCIQNHRLVQACLRMCVRCICSLLSYDHVLLPVRICSSGSRRRSRSPRPRSVRSEQRYIQRTAPHVSPFLFFSFFFFFFFPFPFLLCFIKIDHENSSLPRVQSLEPSHAGTNGNVDDEL